VTRQGGGDALRLVARQPRVHVHGCGPEVRAAGQAAQHGYPRQHRILRVFQAAGCKVQRQPAERIRPRMAVAQQRRHQRVTRGRGIHREARGVDQIAAGMRGDARCAPQARVEQLVRRIVAAVHVTRAHLQLAALE